MSFTDLVFPKTCLGCGKSGGYICLRCLREVGFSKLVCPNCQKPSIDGFVHEKCRKKLGIDGLVSVWKYGGVVKKAILSIKYKYATDVVDELAKKTQLAVESRDVMLSGDWRLIPVPVHWHRENVRGFNQCFELGRKIAWGMGWSFAPNILVRQKRTASQTGLRGDARRKNIKGAFSIDPSAFSKIRNRSLIVFDDVYTTGSTAKETAKVLKRGGAKKVWVLTIAR